MRTIEEIGAGMNLSDISMRVRTDFKFFYENVLGFDKFGGLNKYKAEWIQIAYDNDRVMIRAPSGFGKTVVLGVAFPLWMAILNPKHKILLISKTMSQSKDNMLYQIKDFIEDNEFLKEILMPTDKDKTWNQTQIRLNNGVSMINRPYSINIKSYRADLILLDEIDSYEDPDIYFDYVISRLIPGGKIIGISTPEEGTSTVMELIELRDRKVNQYIFKTYTAIINPKDPNDLSTGESIWEEMFSMTELMNRREEFGDQKWQKNYMCNAHTQSESSVFNAEIIEKCKDYDLKFTTENNDEEIYIGADFAISAAPTADYDVYTVIGKKKDTATIKYAERFKGLPVPEKVRRLEELYHRHNALLIIADESHIGSEVIRQLRTKGISIEGQAFDSHRRDLLLNHLLAMMSNRKLVIPKEKDDFQAVDFANVLEYELFAFKELKSDSTGRTSYISKGRHDDTVMSLALAVKYVVLMQEFDDYIGSSE